MLTNSYSGRGKTMREQLISLVNEMDNIKQEFKISGGNGFPAINTIYDNEKFLRWKQEVHFELQEIYDRTKDKYIWNVLVLIQQRFNGWNDESSFNELSGSLVTIKKNIIKYYPENTYEKEINMLTKKPKVFISHASADIHYVKHIVELLEYIGLRKGDLFCSSVPGYGIPMDDDIYDYLKKQFDDYELHVIFLLSSNYYSSVACMNEMGAAWVLKNKSTIMLVPEYEFNMIKGAVNPNQIGLKLDSDINEVKEKLGEIKDVIIKEFNLGEIPGTRWEEKRDGFINRINEEKIKINKVENKKDDNEKTKDLIIEIDTQPRAVSNKKHLINATESFYKYGLISLGKNSEITKKLIPGENIRIRCGEKYFDGKVHKSIAGRIDGLSSMYRENNNLKDGFTVVMEYDKQGKYIIVS